MNHTYFYTLLQYFKEDVISEEEWRELRVMINSGRFDDLLEDDILISLEAKGKNERWTTELEHEMWLGIESEMGRKFKRFSYRPWVAIAALLLLMLTAGIIFFKSEPLPLDQTKTVNNKNDIAPGGNKAILTLPDGRQVVLNDSTINKVGSEASASIVKAADGVLIYKENTLSSNSHPEIENVAFNTISTPRGGQFQVILPDGTHVWLNAASSLKFPSHFKGRKRSVELIGEAYFEVAKNKQMPFSVHTENQEIEVLGTHFNVSSYAEEATVKTTLLEGSVKVVAHGHNVMLNPGEQSRIDKGTNEIKVTQVSTRDAVAWKNGYFVFNDEKLESIMRRVSRWYDVDYKFVGKQADLSFLGEVERSKNISSLLKILESTGNVHFKMEGRRIIVMP